MIFDIFKNIIIANNIQLIKEIAKLKNLNEKELLDKYIKPEYYLPLLIQELKKEKI